MAAGTVVVEQPMAVAELDLLCYGVHSVDFTRASGLGVWVRQHGRESLQDDSHQQNLDRDRYQKKPGCHKFTAMLPLLGLQPDAGATRGRCPGGEPEAPSPEFRPPFPSPPADAPNWRRLPCWSACR